MRAGVWSVRSRAAGGIGASCPGPQYARARPIGKLGNWKTAILPGDQFPRIPAPRGCRLPSMLGAAGGAAALWSIWATDLRSTVSYTLSLDWWVFVSHNIAVLKPTI